MGYSPLPLDRILQVLSGNGVFKENYVFYQIRLPRALVLTMAGACLAGAGIILQTLSNNDLADSGLLGINSGAGLGVTIFYLFAGEGMLQFSAVLPLVAFISALVAASTVYLLSFSRSHCTSNSSSTICAQRSASVSTNPKSEPRTYSIKRLLTAL